ncbi:MAG: aminotransferase class I/II-fold pyridoxal phosphate-dependent enzyme [Ignavibacteria bacterium]|nr:aminotransferase class I/II-fold pyridoxal phosphate-dependent enzyme [Ignavibacteria bacterium]
MRNNNSFEINLNLNVRGIPVSATLAINELSAKLKKEGKKIYRLGLGQSPFPVPKVVVEELQANAHQKDYLHVKGLPQLREAVAGYHSRRHSIERSAENVLIGPGSKELMFLLQLVYYGDLIIPTPSWVSYAPQAHIIGRHVRWVQTKLENGWKITPQELKKICKDDPSRPRIVILNYPSNPSGVSYKIDELKALAKVAREYKVILLSDEIYGELHFKGQHISISRYYPEGTIISSGLSKWCGAGGWRLGTFTFPASLNWLLDAMAAVASETYTSTSAPIQYAAVRAFNGGIDIERYLVNSRKVLKELGKKVYDKLTKFGVKVPKPDGAFYLFPDFGHFKEKVKRKEINTSKEFCSKLLEDTGVAILPGSAFGRDERELTARLAYVDFDGAKALAAAELVRPDETLPKDFCDNYCLGVLTSIDLLCSWLKQ